MRSLALLANLESGSGEAEDVARRLRDLGAGVAEYALEDVDRALAGGPDRVVVAGGDGSLAPVAAAAGAAGVPLSVIPTGTANDFARELGIPRDVSEACELAVRGERLRSFDVARMDERPFLNVASVGLAPAAAAHASGLKGALGSLAYRAGALAAGLRAEPVPCVVRCDEQELFAGDAWQVTVACSGAFGAGASLDADPADGRLDVLVIEAGSRVRLALRAYGLRSGGLASQAGVRQVRCGSAGIQFEGRRPFNVDGELLDSGSCRFEVESGAVTVVVS